MSQRSFTVSVKAVVKGMVIWAVAVAALSGCAAPRSVQDESYQVLREFANEASKHVEFDPYTARIHFDRAAVQSGFDLMQSRLIANGCGPASPIWTYLGGSLSGDEDGFLNYWYEDTRFQNIEWKRDLFRQLRDARQGWGIVQVDYPKAGMQHGDFTVRALFAYYISWCGADGRGGDYSMTPSFWFDVKSRAKVAAEAAAASAPQPAPAANDDAVWKMRKLKEMLDAGLISQQDYDAKKKVILEGM